MMARTLRVGYAPDVKLSGLAGRASMKAFPAEGSAIQSTTPFDLQSVLADVTSSSFDPMRGPETKGALTVHKLIAGFVDFRERLLPRYAERFREIATGQKPDALFITCADSRVVPDLLASADPGELFTMRNVGNLVPPATADGVSIGDLSEASAIEYAVLVLNVADIVVCGHSECGAMKAVMARSARPETPNLNKWLHHAYRAAFRLEHEGALSATLTPHDQLSQLNLLVQLEHLMSYVIVRERVSAGTLRLNGWWFDVASGSMYVYDRTRRSFVVIDRNMAERLAAN